MVPRRLYNTEDHSMKPLFITAVLSLSMLGSTLGAQAQISADLGEPTTKTFMDGCVVGPMPLFLP
jgi:hypothetical protein